MAQVSLFASVFLDKYLLYPQSSAERWPSLFRSPERGVARVGCRRPAGAWTDGLCFPFRCVNRDGPARAVRCGEAAVCGRHTAGFLGFLPLGTEAGAAALLERRPDPRSSPPRPGPAAPPAPMGMAFRQRARPGHPVLGARSPPWGGPVVPVNTGFRRAWAPCLAHAGIPLWCTRTSGIQDS